MNTTSANNISFSYETYTVKDRITVSYAGQTLFDSGCVGTNGEKIAPISFKDNYDSFNAGGQALIECVRPRLLNYLKNYLDGTQNVDCDDLYNAAFDSHVQIYLDCNFCDVVLSNKAAFIKVLYTNVSNWTAWKQFFQILLSCGPNYKPQFCDDIPQAC
uniref:Uncharacterized protein n=1 Tax=Panagrolaimus sp. JU765 TaxID=591449 RepID=A0AC34QZD9_9BILA